MSVENPDDIARLGKISPDFTPSWELKTGVANDDEIAHLTGNNRFWSPSWSVPEPYINTLTLKFQKYWWKTTEGHNYLGFKDYS